MLNDLRRDVPKLSLIFLYLAVVSAILFFLFYHWAYDDPFITFRYANNLRRGLGFVYNPGERVLSTTTPLFTLLLAGLSLFWGNLPRLANMIGALSLALGGIFLWDLARTWEKPLAGWVSLLLYPTFPLLLTTMGSETPLYLMFCLGTFAFYARRRYNWTAAFAALAVLTRPDGILVPALLALHYLLVEFLPQRTRRPIPWSAVFLFLGLTLPWFIFAWAYFGSPLPVTLGAKQHQGSMADSQTFVSGFLTLVKNYARQWLYPFESILALLGAIYVAWRARPFALFLSWILVYFIAYAALGVSGYYWYYAPLVPGFIVLVGLGVTAIGDWLNALSHRQMTDEETRPVLRRWDVLLSIALVVLLVLIQFNNLLQLRKFTDNRIKIYRAAGVWLNEHSNPGDTIGALEIGVIGYYAQRPMIDFAGLLNPDVAAQLTKNSSYADAAIWATEHYHPSYLVLPAGFFPTLEGEYAAQNCERVKTFPGKQYGYAHNLLVYDCR